MIILEGPDDMGKSTLAQALCSKMKIPIYSIGKSPGSVEGVRMFCSECIRRTADLSIQDRVTQISELVYGNVFERQLVSNDEYAMWLRLLCEREPIIIYCRVACLRQVKHNHAEYDSPEVRRAVETNLEKIRKAYDNLLWSKTYENLVITYDYTKTGFEELYEQLSTRLPRHAGLRSEGETSR